ncbi:kelch-like protein [Leptospira yanagawae]|uniref:Kelch-like protein n=1 Tax=Leptospira yanagawae TaxID=293069 RepID=A0ABY2LXU1_9LEPT|nr:kelch repeat-containing protein [Leptospira yanagawae]TGL17709.1 kelch-like protein [Leptospira yanagawae]
MDSERHFFNLSELKSDTKYAFIVFCDETINPLSTFNFFQSFKTLPTFEEVNNRSFWILGGLNGSNQFISSIDRFDPVENVWVTGVTQIPALRSHSGIISLKNKIYVIGGLFLNSSNQIAVTNLVEEYDTLTNRWRQLGNMPTSLQGFNIYTNGESIYIYWEVRQL